MTQNPDDVRVSSAYLTHFIIGLELALGFSLLLPFYKKTLLSIAMFYFWLSSKTCEVGV